MGKSERSSALDLLRCVALLTVVLVHGVSNVGYYELPVEGAAMYVMTVIRSAAVVCVPLFLMLSGWLMCHKQLTGAYFKGIGKTLGVYVLASLFCGGCFMLYAWLMGNEPLSLLSVIRGIFSYTSAPYGWYVEMYIGLYLLIPFLNILYRGLPSRKEKQWLLAVLLVMTALPRVVNIYRWGELGWWLEPASSDDYIKLLPDWWQNLYPIAYYFLGCYLREFPLPLKKSGRLWLYGLSVLLVGSFAYYRSAGVSFIWGDWQAYASAFTAVQAVALFELLARADLSGWSSGMKKLLASLSDWCFGAYLVSAVFDKVCSRVAAMLCPELPQRFWLLPVAVLGVAAGSLMVSAVLNGIYGWLCRSLGGRKR